MIMLDDSILTEIYGNNIPVLLNANERGYRSLMADYLKKSLKTGKISKLLFEQILYFPDTGIRCSFEWIIDEIANLEGVREETRTPPPQDFRCEILKGLWKKHFYNPRLHMAKNFSNTLKLDQENSKIISEIFNAGAKKYKLNENSSLKIKEKVSTFMAETAVKQMNNRKQTGDWLIFAKHNGVNYYLCIVPHSQKLEDDHNIKNLCKSCMDEFPFLQKIFINEV